MSLNNFDSYTSIPAEDLERAKEFYHKKLGLDIWIDMSPHMVMFKSGENSKIFIYHRAKSKAEHTAIGFIVDDVGKIAGQLKSNGIDLEYYE